MRNNESRGCRCGHSCSTAAADSGDRRRGHAKARINLRKPIAQGTDFHLWHAGMRKDSKTLVLAAFFGYFLSPATESTPPEAYRVARGAVCGGTHGPCRGVRYNRRTGSSVPTDDMRVCASPGRRGEGAPPYGVQQEVQWFGSSRTPPPTSGLQAVQGQDDAHIVPYGRG